MASRDTRDMRRELLVEPEDMNCIICTEPYKDPRLLECGHSFCLACLQTLSTVNEILCPICRRATLLQEGGVNELPKHKLTNWFSKSVSLAKSKRDNGSAGKHGNCSQCSDENNNATIYCKDCTSTLCDMCSVRHVKLEQEFGHQTFPLSPYLFCKAHQRNMSQYLCVTCDVFCCHRCIMGDHNTHQIKDIDKVADQCRVKLLETKKLLDNTSREQVAIDSIEYFLHHAKLIKKKFNHSITNICESLKVLIGKAAVMQENVNEKLDAEIKELGIMQYDMREFIESKTSLKGHISFLTEKASSPEMISRQKDIPTYDKNFYNEMIRKPVIELPDLQDNLEKIEQLLDDCQDNFEASISNFQVSQPCTSIFNLKLMTKFHYNGIPYGLVVDHKLEQIVVRGNDASSPISIYDYNGRKLQTLGKSLTCLSKGINDFYDISIDNKRDLYLVPLSSGKLLCLDKEGDPQDILDITDSPLRSVCHSSRDLYIGFASSHELGKHEFIFISPDGDGDKDTFDPTCVSWPSCICYGQVNMGDFTKEMVIVNNHLYGAHNITLIDECQKEERSLGNVKLLSPKGVCIDPSGRILVCDFFNRRIASLWIDGDDEQFEVLIDLASYKAKPISIACDHVKKRLYVGMTDGEIMVFQNAWAE